MNNSYKNSSINKYHSGTYIVKKLSNLLKGKLFYYCSLHNNSRYRTKTKQKNTLFLLLTNAYFYAKIHQKKKR